MKSILQRDQKYRKFESRFERKAAKETQSEIRRKREEARTVNTNDSDDYSDIYDVWEDSEDWKSRWVLWRAALNGR